MKINQQSTTKLGLAAVVASLALAAPASAQVDAGVESRDASVSHSDQGVALDAAGLAIRSSQHGISLTGKDSSVQADGEGIRANLGSGKVAADVRTGTNRRTSRTRSTTGKMRNRVLRNRVLRGGVQRLADKAKVRARVDLDG
jgi:hypothetical protein